MKKFLSIAAGLAAAAILFATSSQAEELNYRLKWLFNASVAGDIYADQLGYFEKAGLDVKVKEGGPEKNAIKELELGQAAFGVASADQVIMALEKGADVVVLAQIFQINPMMWIYRSDIPEIKELSTLKGKSVGVTFGGNDESILNTLFAVGHLTKDDVDLFSARFDLSPFLTKKVDVWPVYRNSQGVILKERLAKENEQVHFLNPADFGVKFVANSVVTSGKMVREHKDVVEKFRVALVQAWADSIDPANEAASLAAIASRDKGNTEDIVKLQFDSTRELVKAPVFGTIDVEAWKQTEAIMLEQGQIKKAVHVENAMYK